MAPRQPAPPPCSRCTWPLTEVDDDGDTFCHRCGHIDYAEAPLPKVFERELPAPVVPNVARIRGLRGLGYTGKEIAAILGLSRKDIEQYNAQERRTAHDEREPAPRLDNPTTPLAPGGPLP